jgi:hypothetical protein
MLKFKSDSLLLLTLYFSTIAIAVKASPVTYPGSKGQYTVDKEAGTYKGCRFKQSCILLGPKEKIGPTSWKNGEHTYSINGSAVHIYEKNKEIFQDSFVNTPASAVKPTTPEVKYGLITPKCIGSACLGMTFGELKAKLGKKVKYKAGQFMVDIDAVEVIQDGKDQYEICYSAGEKLRDKDKITCLSTDNSHYRTKEGVGPGTAVIKAERVYGKAIITKNTDNESREELKFSKLPKGYERIWFRPTIKSGDGWAGIYSNSSEKDNSSIYKTKKIKPNAYISDIMI